MKIKNYTSSAPPERSVVYIERSLVDHGAKNILYDAGHKATFFEKIKDGGLKLLTS